MSPLSKGTDKFDIQKGRFGGSPHRNGRTLTAEVKDVPGDKDWFKIRLRVFPDPSSPPIKGNVTFFLHETFPENERTVKAINGEAKLLLFAWGAFTVGAVLDDGKTELELDLAELSNTPKRFRES